MSLNFPPFTQNFSGRAAARKNGGVLADEITEEDGNILQRYWITLT